MGVYDDRVGNGESPEKNVWTSFASITPEQIVARHREAVEEVVGRLAQFNFALQQGWLPSIEIGDINAAQRISQMILTNINRLRRTSLAEVSDISRLFEAELAYAKITGRSKTKIRQQLQESEQWAIELITQYSNSGRAYSRQALHWATTFTKEISPFPVLFPSPLLPPIPIISIIWQLYHFRRVGGIPVPVAMNKLHISILAAGINYVIVQFPSFPPSWKPLPKVLTPSATTVAGGRTLTAFDSTGVQSGNPVLPKAANAPAINFFGYMKVIYVTGVPAGCTISFRTVLYANCRVLSPGARAWRFVVPGGAGVPRADPPGGGPNNNVGGGGWVFSDFPNTGAGDPPCTHILRDALFRTWVVELCPRVAPKVLGYYEWGYKQLLHVSAPWTLVNVPIPPAPPAPPAAGGILAPPGGWPAKLPESTPAKWTDAANAPAGARKDYDNLFK